MMGKFSNSPYICQVFTIQIFTTLKLIIAITITYYSALLLIRLVNFKINYIKCVPMKSIVDEQLPDPSVP